MRRRFGLLVSTLLVLVVVAGLLLMHGFEAVSPEPLATHIVADDEASSATMVTVGLGVFVSAIAVSFAVALLFVGSLVDPLWRRVGGLTIAVAPVLRGPPRGFSYERCVIRV